MAIIFFKTVTITPAIGVEGDTVTILNTGSGFRDTMIVLFGAVSATDINVDESYGNTQQKIICKVPAGTGTVNIFIQTPDGESKTIVNGFTYYVAPVPSGDVNIQTCYKACYR